MLNHPASYIATASSIPFLYTSEPGITSHSQIKMSKRNAQQLLNEANDIENKGKRSSKMKFTTPLPILPQDVIFFSIFIHLPAQFLLLLRSLSRSSLQLIDNPRFICSHALAASPHLIFLAFNRFNPRIQKLFAIQINRGLRSRNRVTPLNYFKLLSPIFILATCNGLLLVHKAGPNAQDILVANPIRRQWRMLPKPLGGPFGPDRQYIYGFVFDAASNLYKIVQLLQDAAGVILCEILTLGLPNECWRRVNVPKPSRRDGNMNVNYRLISIGSMLYWVDGCSPKWPSFTVFDPSEHHIMSMDAIKEEFRRVKPPTSAKGLCRLFALGRHLAMLSFDGIMLDIWVLHDCESDTWVKRHHVMNKCLVKRFGNFGRKIGFELSASLHDGKLIIFKTRNRLFKYDLVHESFEEVRTHYGYLGWDPNDWVMTNPCAHVDSLVWP